jgi:hypothetical protein
MTFAVFVPDLISNHPVAGSVIVTHQDSRAGDLLFQDILWGPAIIMSAHDFSQGEALAWLSGDLSPFFLAFAWLFDTCDIFATHVTHIFFLLRPFQVECCQIIISALSKPR